MGYNHIPNKTPTGNDFAAFLKVADFDTVYRRVGKFRSDAWTEKPKVEKNTPLSTDAIKLLSAIYGQAEIDRFISQFSGKPVAIIETGENSEAAAAKIAQLKAKHQAEIEQLHREKIEREAAHQADIQEHQKRLADQKAANQQRINELNERLNEKNANQSDIKAALEGKNKADVSAAQQRIADLTAEKRQLQTELDRLRSDNTTLDAERNKFNAQNSVAQQRINDLNATIKRLESERGQSVNDAETAAYDRAEADFLRKSDALVDERIKVRLKQQEDAHIVAMRQAHAKHTQADTDAKRIASEKDETIKELRGINQALETRLKTTWGLWRLPTRLQIPPIMSLILAAIGLYKMMGIFGIGLFVMLLVVYLEAMDIVKNPKYKSAARYLLISVTVFEGLFLALHPTTVKLLLEEMLGDEGIKKLVFTEGQTAFGVSLLISVVAVFCVRLDWVKTKDAASL